jgi:iron(III) transport system substrate-binding protein
MTTTRKSPRRARGAILAAGLGLLALPAAALPPGYPASYQALVDAAAKEGTLVVYSTTDTAYAGPLLREFKAAYPAIQVEYNDMNTTEVFNRYLGETAASAPSADVLWSSSMDLQFKLVSEGYAATYASPELPQLPGWAHWRDQAYGTTFEPITFVYNKRLVPEAEVPRTHAALAALLREQPQRYQGKVTTFDAEKSGLGFLLATQDAQASPASWDLVKAAGARGVRLQASTGTMMERIASGEALIGYNVLGSYVMTRMKKDPSIGVVLPSDYMLVISRLMFVSRTARHPAAARVWLDFALSHRGQTVLAEQSELYSVRLDVTGRASGTHLTREMGAVVRPVAVGPDLLTYLDQARRLEFMKRWHESLGRK